MRPRPIARAVANPEVLWPQASAELRSAWTSGGTRPHTNKRKDEWGPSACIACAWALRQSPVFQEELWAT